MSSSAVLVHSSHHASPLKAVARWTLYPLIFATADLHRWHHDADSRRALVNFGAVLMLLDRVLGTFREARETAPVAVRIAETATTPTTYLGWPQRTAGRPPSNT